MDKKEAKFHSELLIIFAQVEFMSVKERSGSVAKAFSGLDIGLLREWWKDVPTDLPPTAKVEPDDEADTGDFDADVVGRPRKRRMSFSRATKHQMLHRSSSTPRSLRC